MPVKEVRTSKDNLNSIFPFYNCYRNTFSIVFISVYYEDKSRFLFQYTKKFKLNFIYLSASNNFLLYLCSFVFGVSEKVYEK